MRPELDEACTKLCNERGFWDELLSASLFNTTTAVMSLSSFTEAVRPESAIKVC
jgi:hypothetical protein